MASVALVGATGLVGSHILSTLKRSSTVDKIWTFSRKEIPADPKVIPIISKDSAEWAQRYPAGSEIFFSALGTTRANAGSLEKQRQIDYDLNVELAKAARAAGSKIYVLISTNGASSSSRFGYPKMKGELEEAVSAIDFDHVVILRPGLLVGKRTESRAVEGVFRTIANTMGAISSKLKDFWAQDDEVVARAAVSAGIACLSGQHKEKVKIVDQAEIVRLGRTEWKA